MNEVGKEGISQARQMPAIHSGAFAYTFYIKNLLWTNVQYYYFIKKSMRDK